MDYSELYKKAVFSTYIYSIIGFIDVFLTGACAWYGQDELCCFARGEIGNWHAISHLG